MANNDPILLSPRQQKKIDKDVRREVKKVDIPLERYAILRTDGYVENESIIFCSNCDLQYKPGTPHGPEDGGCPNCHLTGKLKFVHNNQKLRDTIAQIRARLDPERWEANFGMLLRIAAERRAKLPKEIQERISEHMSGMQHKVKAITARNQDFTDPEFSRRLRQLHLTILGALIDTAEATLSRERVQVLN